MSILLSSHISQLIRQMLLLMRAAGCRCLFWDVGCVTRARRRRSSPVLRRTSRAEDVSQLWCECRILDFILGSLDHEQNLLSPQMVKKKKERKKKHFLMYLRCVNMLHCVAFRPTINILIFLNVIFNWKLVKMCFILVFFTNILFQIDLW